MSVLNFISIENRKECRSDKVCHPTIFDLLHRVFFSLVLFAGLSADIMAAKVSVWVHPAVVAPNQTLTLTVSVEGEIVDKPDFSILDNDFQRLRHSNQSSVDMKRGSTQIKRSWEVVLLPRKMGRTTIPAIKVGSQATTPLTIEVNNKPAIVHTRNERIFIEIEATPQQPYVQSQVLLAQRLYYAIPLDKAELSLPVVKNNAAEMVALNTRPSYQRKIKGRRYTVIERTYALFPKKSGLLTIEPAEFHGLVPDDNSVKTFSNFNLYTRQQHAEHIISQSLTIMVKPRAASFSAKNWLPANNITMYGKWSIDEGSEITVGEPISVDMGIISSGLRSASIADLTWNVPDGIKVYAEKPRFNFTTAHSGLSGIRKQKITFIATQTAARKGQITLPALRLAWWNTVTEQQEEAVLAGISFKVVGVAGTMMPSKSLAPTVATEQKQTMLAFFTNRWWLTVLSVLLFLFLVVFFIVYQRYRLARKKTQQMSLAIGMPAPLPAIPPESSKLIQKKVVFEQEINKERLLANVQSACEAAKPIQAQQALQQWAEEMLPIKPVTLSMIATINADFAREIVYLSQVLYAKQAIPWNGQRLWQVVEQYQTSTAIIDKKSVLQDLYPREKSINNCSF